jgi:hypothetical protein
MYAEQLRVRGTDEGVRAVRVGSRRVSTACDGPLIAEDLADAAKRTNIAIGTPERTQVYEFVSMVPFFGLLLFLRDQPQRESQHGEYGHRGKARQCSGFHLASSDVRAGSRGAGSVVPSKNGTTGGYDCEGECMLKNSCVKANRRGVQPQVDDTENRTSLTISALSNTFLSALLRSLRRVVFVVLR